MAEHVVLPVVELDPGALLLQDRQHAPDETGAARVVGPVLHLAVEPIEFRIAEVGRIRPAALGAGILAFQQEKEILGIGEVGAPAPD